MMTRLALATLVLLLPTWALAEGPPPEDLDQAERAARVEALLNTPIAATLELAEPPPAPFRAQPAPESGVWEQDPAPTALEIEETRARAEELGAEAERRREVMDRVLRRRQDEVEAAAAIARGEGAPLIQRSTTEVFPYGESQPMLTCTPDRACDIELEPGERVYNVACGDNRRWQLERLYSGDPAGKTTHVIAKPRAHGISTNIVIGTSRRTYHVGLHSPPLEDLKKADTHYIRHVAFYYPEDFVADWTTPDDLAFLEQQAEAAESRYRAEQQRLDEATTLATMAGQLDFRYTLKGKGRVPWRPTAVWDDGLRTYIQLPDSHRGGHPAVVIEEAGEERLPNLTWDPTQKRILIHAVFESARLFEGVGRKRLEIRIRKGDR